MSKWSKTNGSAGDKPADKPTVRAVLAYAEQLRKEAAAYAEAHPGEPRLYSLSEAAARKVSQQLGPEAALDEIRRRAVRRWLELDEDRKRAAAARRDHRVHLSAAADVRVAGLSNRTLGQRLDEAILGLGVVSDVSASRLDSEPVSGGRPDGGPPKLRPDKRRDDALHDVHRAVERVERELASHRRRLVEEEAA